MGIGWLAVGGIPEGLLWQGLTLGLLAMLYLAAYSARGMKVSHALLLTLTGMGALVLIRQMPAGNDFKMTVSVVVVLLLVAVYFRQVHDQRRTLLPKPIAAAIIFALGCTLANRFFAPWDSGLSSRLEELMLVCLFASNLTGIRAFRMERAEALEQRAVAAGQLHHGVVILGVVVGVVSLALVMLGTVWDRLALIAGAVGVGLLVVSLLHRRRMGMNESTYRFWVDGATLVPIPFLWLV